MERRSKRVKNNRAKQAKNNRDNQNNEYIFFIKPGAVATAPANP